MDGIDPTGRPNGPTQVAMEPSADGAYAYLATAVRSATAWQVTLDVIDLRAGPGRDSVDLLPGSTTDGSPVSTVDAPTLRIAPDGRHALVGSGVERGGICQDVGVVRAGLDRRPGRARDRSRDPD